MTSSATPATDPSTSLSVPVLINFLNTVPAPLTAALITLAPYISRVRLAAEIISWRSSWADSWLALAAWWGVCLLAELGLRYLLPIAILFALAVIKWTTRPRSILPPVTEQNLEIVVSDLCMIKELAPAWPVPPAISPAMLRVAALLYLPYLLLTCFVRLRVLVGIAGTLALSWRAPWAYTIRRSLWRSAWVRWSIYRTWSVLSGEPLPPMILSSEPTITSHQPGKDIRFVFTIYENQRWWMGLDWTAALLPAERPSWCSHTHDPVLPPSAFTLPEQTTVLLRNGKDESVKRTATWRWEEGEWRVLVKKDGLATRIEKPLPTANPDSSTGSTFAKITGKLKESHNEGAEASASVSSPKVAHTDDKEATIDDSSDIGPEEPATDADGWVYCDNKWETPSSSNKLGKFTRYRRWSRIAVVSEIVEIVDPGEAGVQPSIIGGMLFAEPEVQSPTTTAEDAPTDINSQNPVDADTDVDDPSKLGKDGKRRATLRQRMQNSLRKGTTAVGPA